jgi:hypothetical protein
MVGWVTLGVGRALVGVALGDGFRVGVEPAVGFDVLEGEGVRLGVGVGTAFSAATAASSLSKRHAL